MINILHVPTNNTKHALSLIPCSHQGNENNMAWEEPRKTGMLYRRVGNSGLHVSVLGLGGWLT
jgi:hypothetical protein